MNRSRRSGDVVVENFDPPIAVTIAVRVSQLAVALALGFGLGSWTGHRTERTEIALGLKDSPDPNALACRHVVAASRVTRSDVAACGFSAETCTLVVDGAAGGHVQIVTRAPQDGQCVDLDP